MSAFPLGSPRRSSSRARHVPMRTCAGCGARSPKASLWRMALAGRSLEWRSAGGRGTYLHPTSECSARFLKGTKPLRGLRVRAGRQEREILLAARGFSPSVEATQKGVE